jgi:hypothetical protein
VSGRRYAQAPQIAQKNRSGVGCRAHPKHSRATKPAPGAVPLKGARRPPAPYPSWRCSAVLRAGKATTLKHSHSARDAGHRSVEATLKGPPHFAERWVQATRQCKRDSRCVARAALSRRLHQKGSIDRRPTTLRHDRGLRCPPHRPTQRPRAEAENIGAAQTGRAPRNVGLKHLCVSSPGGTQAEQRLSVLLLVPTLFAPPLPGPPRASPQVPHYSNTDNRGDVWMHYVYAKADDLRNAYPISKINARPG